MNYQLVNKYLRGEASETEVGEIFRWIEASQENKKEFIDYKKVWALTTKDNVNENNIWKFFFSPRISRKRLQDKYREIFRYAAILLLVFGAGMAVTYFAYRGDISESLVYQKSTSITAPLGQMTNVVLPDGSIVMLNSGSSITYHGNFSLGQRNVQLSGEAYFDVAKDQEHPFLVETDKLNFKVYGTSFNIEAYPEVKVINSTLVEGSIGLINKQGKELLLLSPGENAHFDSSTSKIVVTHVNTRLYTSWKDGLITFRNEKLKDIAKKIERWYNVEVVINNPKLGEEAYWGTIMKNKPIDQILEVLKLTSSLKYEIISRPDKPTLIYWN